MSERFEKHERSPDDGRITQKESGVDGKNSRPESEASRLSGYGGKMPAPAPQINHYYGEEILRQTNEAVIVVDNEERVIYLNPAAERQYDVSASDSPGCPLKQILKYTWLCPEDEKDAFASLRESGCWRGENIHLKKNGERIYVESNVSILRNSENEVIGILAIIRDITRRKRRELKDAFLAAVGKQFDHLSGPGEIMQALGEKLAEFLNVSRVFFIEVKPAENLSSVLFDWCAEELPSTVGVYRLEEYGGEAFLQELKQGNVVAINDVTSDPITSAAAEKFASLRIGSLLNAPYLNRGELKFLLAVQHQAAYEWREDEIELMRELSGRVWTLLENARAEEALRESEEKYRTLFKTIDEGFCIVEMIFDRNGKPHDYIFLEANSAFFEMTGLPEDAVGRSAREMVPELEEFWFETYGRVALTGKSVRFENNSVPMNRWFDVHASRFGGEDSRLVAIVFKDTTDRKLAEHALRQSEIENREILESISDGFFALDDEWRFSFVNRAAEEILAVEPESLHGTIIWEVYQGLVGTEFERVYREVAEQRVPQTLTSFYPDHERWYEVNVYPAAKGITVYLRSVTEIKQTEQSLREARNRLESSLTGANLGAWTYDTATGEFWADERARRMHGYKTDEDLSFEKAGAHLHPKDREEIQKALVEAVENRAKLDLKYRVFNPDGSISWIASYAELVVEENGDEGGIFYGVTQNITDKKIAEEKLRETNAVLSAISLNTPTLIYVKDRESRLLSANPATCAAFGRPLQEIIGRNQAEYLNGPAEAELIRSNDLQIIESGKTSTFEEKFVTRNGLRVFLSTKTPYQNDEGEIIGLIGISVDITERKQAEEALVQSERQLQQMADAMPQVVWIADPDGEVYYYNRRVENFFGIGKTDGGKWNWQPVFHSDDLDETVAAWETAVREKSAYAKEHRIMMKTGGYRWHLSRAFPIFDDAGNISRWYGTATDIHELKESETERQRLLEEANAANLAKDEFLAILSHELRTPLNTIFGWSQILLRKDLDSDKIRQAVEVIARSVRLQNALIEDLLDVSRIISGKMKLEPENFSLVSVIESSINAIRPAAEKQEVKVESDLDPEADEMFGDRHRLHQIISNLLMNAVKFTPQGGVISIRLKREKDTARLEISDTGIGIAPDLLPHIFDRFRQAESSSKRKYGGLGLGLTIVKYLVELHGGTISVLSEGEGKGTVFTVKLPLPPKKITSADLRQEADGVQENGGKNAKPLQGIRILVVDDDKDSLDLMCFALQDQGAEVVGCDSGREALKTLLNDHFQLILSDLGMPELDGYDLIEQLRARENESGAESIPAIALTGYVSAEDRERVLQAGFQMHLPKPVDLEKLSAAALEFIKKQTLPGKGS